MAEPKAEARGWGDLEDDDNFSDLDEYDVPETRITGPDENGIKTVKVRRRGARLSVPRLLGGARVHPLGGRQRGCPLPVGRPRDHLAPRGALAVRVGLRRAWQGPCTPAGQGVTQSAREVAPAPRARPLLGSSSTLSFTTTHQCR